VTTSASPVSEDAASEPDSVHLRRSVAAPLAHVWECLCSRAGSAALLGSGAEIGSKGESWRSEDGPHGVVRSYHPQEQLRVSWHERDDDPPALVDLRLSGDGDRTVVDLTHERIPPGSDTGSLRQRWDGALGRLEALATG
jgi:uncharacterized protein YndB with AHSA1/START domain